MFLFCPFFGVGLPFVLAERRPKVLRSGINLSKDSFLKAFLLRHLRTWLRSCHGFRLKPNSSSVRYYHNKKNVENHAPQTLRNTAIVEIWSPACFPLSVSWQMVMYLRSISALPLAFKPQQCGFPKYGALMLRATCRELACIGGLVRVQSGPRSER